MARLKQDLPPFAALLAFYAAATHARYRDAADSLGISESAVSHQIRKLETFFQQPLFERAGGTNRLTAAGQRYLKLIDPAVNGLLAASDAMRPQTGRQVVRLTLPPSLAATWLIPLLSGFEAGHPEINLQLVPTARVVDLRREQMDFAIRHGKGAWPDVDAVFLFAETATPVCAPGYIEALPAGAAAPAIAESLARARLITNGNIPDEWREWMSARGLPLALVDDAIMLDTQEQCLEVAQNGHGLALGRQPIVDKRLQDGRLIAPFGGPDLTGAAYYLCFGLGADLTAAARKVMRWLEAQSQDTSQT